MKELFSTGYFFLGNRNSKLRTQSIDELQFAKGGLESRSHMCRGLVFTLVCIAASSARAEPFSDLSFKDASQKAGQTGKVVMVDFYTTWCAPCRLLDKRTWTDAEVIALLEKKTVALRIDAEKETELAKRYEIDAYPTVVLIKPDGTEIGRLIGYRDPKTFLKDFDAAIHGNAPPRAIRRAETILGTNNPVIRMEHGTKLARDGKNAEALQEYLWCFDHGDEVSRTFGATYRGVLLTFLRELAGHYPAAKEALERERDERKIKLQSDTVDQRTITELISLNRALGQPEKNLEVFDTIPKGSPVRQTVSVLIRDVLLAAKRYSDALNGEDPKSAFAKQIDLFNYMVDMIDPKSPSKSLYEQSYRTSTVMSAAQLFEAVAGLKRNSEAEELARRIMDFDPSPATRTILAQAAERADNSELARFVKQ